MQLNAKYTRYALLSTIVATAVLATACGGGNGEETAAEATETAMAVSPTSTDGTWTKVATERSSFTVSTSTYVRYGSGTSWVGKWVTGTVPCTNDFFGSDPLMWVTKECQKFTPSGSTATAKATLSWTASATTGVASYKLYYGSTSGAYAQTYGNGINMGNVTNYSVTGLTSGKTYYFTVTAVDGSGKESTYSNEVAKVVN
jgi:hypothetical protein